MGETIEELIAYCRENDRVCPAPQLWSELWEVLPNRTRVGNSWNPAPPLILAAWHETPALMKMVRLREHIEWSARHGALEQMAQFLRALREEEWHHVGE